MHLAAGLPALSNGELIARVLAAAGLGALVGLDRELSDQPAGFRTHILVSLGSALFTLAGAYGLSPFSGQHSVSFDPSRIAAQVVTGIGFLGAGAIIRQGMNIRGLTTAAALWVTAAIGVAVGLGYWTGAVATALVTVFVLFTFKRIERLFLRKLKPGRFEFVMSASSEVRLADMTQTLESNKGKIEAVKMETDDAGAKQIAFTLRLPPRSSPQEFADLLMSIEGVTNVDWTR
jgi:putative Mg2+ transporter-C (MgtC) family protein